MSPDRYWHRDDDRPRRNRPSYDADGRTVVPRGGIPYVVSDEPPDPNRTPSALELALALRAEEMREAVSDADA